MPLLYLLFGHLLADFVLQPEKLVNWKHKHWKGMLLHSSVHFCVNLVLFWAFLPNLTVILALLTLSASHFVIDALKVQYEIRGRSFRVYFLVDQLLHLLIMFGIAGVINIFAPAAKIEGAFIVMLLSLIVFFTYVIEIYLFQIKREKFINAVFQPNYRAMLKRALVVTSIYALVIIFTVYKVAALV